VARRHILGAVVGIVACVMTEPFVRPAFERTRLLVSLTLSEPPEHLPSPVALPSGTRLEDTWGAPREGGRRHEGVDIFAPRGTPVRSTTDGVVTRVGTNRLGGTVVFVLGPGLESHYYAHLDRVASIKPGDIVHPGEVLGYVGRTGNARTTPFHLHYGIYRFGEARNPFVRLVTPQSPVD
jgi:murein DD-endopeptidase MepM/ murein hydrolase activator NlpD